MNQSTKTNIKYKGNSNFPTYNNDENNTPHSITTKPNIETPKINSIAYMV
jgi:hypothetical protein